MKTQGKNEFQQIEMARGFFDTEEVAEQLYYPDLKVHKTGNTRCISYFISTIHKLNKLHLVHLKEKSYRMSLFGLYIITVVHEEYLKGMDLGNKYNYAFEKNHIFYEFAKNARDYDNTLVFLNTLKRDIPENYESLINSYIREYFGIASSLIDVKLNDEYEFVGLRYDKKEFDKAFNELWRRIEHDKEYDNILNIIEFK